MAAVIVLPKGTVIPGVTAGASQATAKKPSKYHNKKTARNGILFDSVKEANRYSELLLMQRAGEITDLKLQPEFTLQEGFMTPSGEKIRPIKYKADFSYRDKSGTLVVEDTKGVRTKEYSLKKKIMAEHGIMIVEL